MLYLIAICLGIIIGIAYKGKLSNLLYMKVQKSWIIMLAFFIMIISQLAGTRFAVVNSYAAIINGCVFVLLFLGFWYNRRYFGIWSIGLGGFLNGLVMMVNGGRMPVDIEAVKRANIPLNALGDIKHNVTQINSGVKLPFLADIIDPPGVLGFLMRIVSIGDLFVVIGLFLLVLQIVTGYRLDD